MDADYAMQAVAEIQGLREALELRTAQRDFWLGNYEELSENNYQEAKQQEDYDVELILQHCCEDEGAM